MRERITELRRPEPRPGQRYVLYWCRANRRVEANHALAFAIETANRLRLPLLAYEHLTCTDPHDTARSHTFVLEGIPEFQRDLGARGIGYVFYLQRKRDDPGDMLDALADHAAAVVADDAPSGPPPAAAHYLVDSSCIVPMRLLAKREYAAYTIRPKIRKVLPEFLVPAAAPPAPDFPYRCPAPPFHARVTAEAIPSLVASCEVDRTVPPSMTFRGGRLRAQDQLRRFLEDRLRQYARNKNEPAAHATSELSPYLHYGHISSLEVALAARAHASAHQLIAEEFLEELIVRRELAFNFARHERRPDSIAALPEWARETLREHARDARDPAYSREQLEAGLTYDELWNATQTELRLRGKIHGYYRMYWGKKILEWSASAEEALENAIYLNDRYALDGRDPNTYANILWCFGLHDRPWPERPIFGKIRYMSREGMERKTNVRAYLREIDAVARTGVDPFGAR